MIAESLPNAERWARIEEVFHQARTLQGESLGALLDRQCGGDTQLRTDVEALLQADRDASAGAGEARPVAPSLAGRRVGNYALERLIGAGGMGTVYLARRCDGQFDREAAVKILGANLRDEFFTERFAIERQLLAGLDHPNITRLLDSGVSGDGDPYLVLEYVDGRPIDEYCDTGGLPIGERVRLFLEACTAVDYAHGRKVIHRDLKPSNILVSRDGAVKLLDLGAAKLLESLDPAPTLTRFRMMTPRYASPEQLRGETVTAASDIYSLGVLLYELLLGAWPFGNPESVVAGLERAVRDTPPRPPREAVTEAAAARRGLSKAALTEAVSGDLWRVIGKAIEADAAKRYASAAELAQDLERYGAGQRVLARSRGGHRRTVVAALAITIGIAAGVGIWRWRAKIDTPSVIAVLPFRDLSPGADNRYLSDGVTDEISTGLEGIKPLLVISKASTTRYSGAQPDVREVGRALNASNVLEGSVVREGDRVKVRARLERSSDGGKIWDRSYDRSAADLYRLRTDVARDVASSLHASFEPAPQKHVVKNQEAMDLLMRARVESEAYTAEAFAKAESQLRRAIAIDGEYALAYASLGAVVINRASVTGRKDAEEHRRAVDEGKSYYRKALELDPALVTPRVNLASFALQENWAWQQAEAEYRAALANGPSAIANTLYGVLLVDEGRFYEADQRFAAAMEQNPASTAQMINIAAARQGERRFPDTLAIYQLLADRSPNDRRMHAELEAFRCVTGHPEEALAFYDQSPDASPAGRFARAQALARLGRKQEALDLVQPMEADYKKNLPAASFAAFYAAQGDMRAIAWLERAVADHDFLLLSIGVSLHFDPIRSTPEFQAIVRRVGLK